MRVAIDVGPLTSGDSIRGVGMYTRELVNYLEKEGKTNKLQIFKFDSEAIRESIDDFDVVHIPYFNPYSNTVPISKKSKIIVTIHDVIPLIYPKNYPSGVRGGINLHKQKLALKKVSAVITDSETSKKDIVRFLGICPEKVHVVYLAPKVIFKKNRTKKPNYEIIKKYGLPQKYILYVGDINYNKNIKNLVVACKKVSIPLVIVGKQAASFNDSSFRYLRAKGPRDLLRFLLGRVHPEIAHLSLLEKEFNDNKIVTRIGFVSDEDLVSICKLSSIYCQPSLYEGFGLPVLEAQSSGVPVLISKTQALVEIANNSAIIFDPYSVDDLSGKLNMILRSDAIRKELVVKGFVNSNKYSWEKVAQETINIYQYTCGLGSLVKEL